MTKEQLTRGARKTSTRVCYYHANNEVRSEYWQGRAKAADAPSWPLWLVLHPLSSPSVITIHIPVPSFPQLPLLYHTSLHLSSLGAENFLNVAAGTFTASNCHVLALVGRSQLARKRIPLCKTKLHEQQQQNNKLSWCTGCLSCSKLARGKDFFF